MGKWIEMLVALPELKEINHTPSSGHCQNCQTPLLTVLAVAQGVRTAVISSTGTQLPTSSLASSGQTCAACRHRLPRGTCGQPESAGLVARGAGFGIAWPPEGHGAGCPAFQPKVVDAPDERPYRLSHADADSAHADPWDKDVIQRFQARASRLRLAGFADDDAYDLAERLHLLGVQGDGRVLCLSCRHLTGTLATGWRCTRHRAAGLATPALAADFLTLPQRCGAAEGAL